MKELEEYRTQLLEKLLEAANAFREACLNVKDPYAPLNADGWSVHQIAIHTRDVEALVYGLRARRTAMENDPEFPNFDGDAYMAANYNSSEPLRDIVDGIVEHVRSTVELLRSLPPEAWSRVSHHTTLGKGITLQSWVERSLAHLREHLETIRAQGS